MDKVADVSSANDILFSFDAVCEKAWQDEKGKMFVRAVASDDRLDLQRDRMSANALKKMADAAKKGVPFLETHRSVFEFGKTVGGDVVDFEEGGKKVQKFVVDVELDGDFPQARKLFKEVAGNTCKRQLSIGGKLNLKNKEAVHVEMTPTGLARTINDLDLDHIASTRESQAANPRTSFTEAISKALDDAEKGLAKEKGDGQNVTQMQFSPEMLAALKKVIEIAQVGGKDMNKAPETPATPATPAETPTTPTETAPTTEIASKAVGTPRNTETPKTPATRPEQTALTPEAPKFGQIKGKDAASASDLANDIAILLAKKKPFPGAATPFGSEDSKDSEDEMTDEEKAVVDSLWATRFVLAKQASGAELGAGEKAKASDIVGAGPYAPRSGAKGLAAGPFIPDKAPKGDTTDMGTSAVTDHRKNIQVGGEIKSTAPTAKDALDLTLRNAKEADRLPQGVDLVSFGKTLGEEIISKSAEITKSLVIDAIERVASDSVKSATEIQKSVAGLGDVVNDSSKRLAAMESRLARVEKAGGVSQSGPKGKEDAAPERARGGVWGGLFNRAAKDALAQY